MKILEKLKKWIAGLTAVSMVLAFLPATAWAVQGGAKPTIDNFTLIKVVAGPDQELGNYISGANIQVNLAVTPEINLRANTIGSPATGSVVFSCDNCNLDGDSERIESSAPFAAAGDSGGNYYAWTPELGTHTITATPYTGTGGNGQAGEPKSVTLTIVNLDVTAPILTEVTPVPTPTNDNTPSYAFHSDEAGSIAYGGSCGNGNIVNAVAGDNTVTFGTLTDGNYNDCTITVTDASNNPSLPLGVNGFIVDTKAPDAPVNLSPANGTFTNSLAQISWNPVTDTAPVTYMYQSSLDSNLRADGAFVTSSYTSGWLTDSSIPTPGTPEGVYNWHVKAKDGAGNIGAWSTAWTVTVDKSAPEISKIYQTDDSSEADISGNVVNLTKKTSFTVEAMDVFLGHDNPGGISQYLWSSTNPNVHFGTSNSSTTEIWATNEDGVYEISVTATDKADNSVSKKFVIDWDYVQPVGSPFAIVAGDGIVNLTWTDPEDKDFDGVEIYRSTIAGELGTMLGKVEPGVEMYDDKLIVPGMTYYYTIVAVDDEANKSEDNKQLKVVLPVIAPTSAPLVVSTDPGAGISGNTGAGEQTVAGTQSPEVKGGTTNENNDPVGSTSQNNSRTLSWFGVGLLALLALVGLYLLYLQNPEWFGWIFFWKRRKEREKR